MTVTPADNPLRFGLRVTLKLAATAVGVAALVIALQYMGLWPAADGRPTRVALATIATGDAVRVDSAHGTIWVLHRGDAARAESGAEPWFVAHDRGPLNGCPLLWQRNPGEFRETCSDARYDAAGDPVGDTPGGSLGTPPHRFDADAGVVIIEP